MCSTLQAFDPDLFPFFQGYGSDAVTSTDAGGRTVVQTPQVTAYVREFFQCEELRGAETEDDGGRGSSLSHWERRLFEVRH